MHVVRHDHVSHQQKLIPLANLSQCVHEYVLRANRPQQGQPPVTAEGEKVKIAAAVVTLELLGHKPASKTLRVTPTRGAPLSRICEKTRWHRHSCLCAFAKSNKFSFGEATYNGASRLFLPASLLCALLHPARFCGMNRSACAERPPPHRPRFLRAMKSLFLFPQPAFFGDLAFMF